MVMPSPLETTKKSKIILQASFGSQTMSSSSYCAKQIELKDVSAQTVLTLPPQLPPEVELLLQPFCTYNQEQEMFEEYEITANGSLRRKLFFEEHSDGHESEHTDEEIHLESKPPPNFEPHTPVIVSPDLSRDLVARGMRRHFGTPIQKQKQNSQHGFRNKILDVVDIGEMVLSPIEFHTPKRSGQESVTSSLASASISPVTKVSSSDEEKNNLTSPESEAMATCLDCISSGKGSDEKGICLCINPNKSILKRSASMKDTPQKNKRLSEKRSQSMSSLHRSRSVLKLDFTGDMSIDGSFYNRSQADSEGGSPEKAKETWSLEDDTTIQQLVKIETMKSQAYEMQSSTKVHHINVLDETPKINRKNNIFTHEISKIRASAMSPLHMSLDNSLDNLDIPLSLEEKKIDFNMVDLKFLTENTQVEHVKTKLNSESTSFKRVDSGYNDNTFYANASSYYESAIKPSELTVTNVSTTTNKTALKEITNVNWMRVDSGFKDETSGDSTQFYNESSLKKAVSFGFEAKDKENVEEFDRFLVQAGGKCDTMSMSDIFTEELTFNCNFSSTPSKNKSRKINS